MWNHRLNIIIFFICTFCSFGQQKEVLGFIKNAEGNPVSFANIVIQDTTEAQKSIAYGYSDEKGRFSLAIPSNITQIVINITAIGYQEKSVVSKLTEKQLLIIYLEEKVNQLGEVVIKAKKSYRHTKHRHRWYEFEQRKYLTRNA